MKRAAPLKAVRWSLVVPIDYTPNELEWFESLTGDYNFPCEWLGRTWLDSQLAQMPEIATYYAHGRRYEFSELTDLLQRLNAPPPTGPEFFSALAEQMNSAIDKLNQLDPHYVFALSRQANGRVAVSAISRCPGAEPTGSPTTPTSKPAASSPPNLTMPSPAAPSHVSAKARLLGIRPHGTDARL